MSTLPRGLWAIATIQGKTFLEWMLHPCDSRASFLRILLSSMLFVFPKFQNPLECCVPKRGKIFKRGYKNKSGREGQAREGKPESCTALRVKSRTRYATLTQSFSSTGAMNELPRIIMEEGFLNKE